MNGQAKVSAGEVFGAMGDLARRHVGIFALATGFMTVIQAIVDLALGDGAGALFGTISVGVINFFVTYHVTEQVLRGEGLMTVWSRSYGAMFGANILTTLGVALGFVLLIVPGLYLLARWSMVAPIIVAEGLSAGQAMSRSWDATRNSVWSLAAVYLVYFLMFVALFMVIGIGVAAGVATGADAESSLGTTIAAGAGASVMGMIAVLISVAVYRIHAGNGGQYEDVFA